MAETTAREGELRGADQGSLTLTAQWASADGGVTIKGLLVSCCKEEKRSLVAGPELNYRGLDVLVNTHSKCFQNEERPQEVKPRITVHPSNGTVRYRPES